VYGEKYIYISYIPKWKCVNAAGQKEPQLSKVEWKNNEGYNKSKIKVKLNCK